MAGVTTRATRVPAAGEAELGVRGGPWARANNRDNGAAGPGRAPAATQPDSEGCHGAPGGHRAGSSDTQDEDGREPEP